MRDRICTCRCHTKGLIVRHIAPCCQFTYQKYINEDGSIDNEILGKLIRKQELREKGIILLDREEFKKQVFTRDGGKCIFCEKDAVDAHHIFDRKLFTDEESLGGYFLYNGASLCEEHHWEAEKTDISIAAIINKISPKFTIYPKCLDSEKVYDKWGNEIISINGFEFRDKGPLFNDGGVQKVLKDKLYMFEI